MARIPDPPRTEFHDALVAAFSTDEMDILLGRHFHSVPLNVNLTMLPPRLRFLKIIEQVERDELEVEFAQKAIEMKPLSQALQQAVTIICNRKAATNGIATPIPQPVAPQTNPSPKNISPAVVPSSSHRYDYDAYVSFNRIDERWVNNTLIEKLREAGLNICTDADFVANGKDAKSITTDVLRHSKKLLPVFSTAYLGFGWPQFYKNVMPLMSPAEQHERVIPILYQRCTTPESLKKIEFSNWLTQTTRAIDMASAKLVERIREQSSTPSSTPGPRQDSNARPQLARHHSVPPPAQPILQGPSRALSLNQPTIALTRQQLFGAYQTDLTAFAWSPNGEAIATASKGGTVWIRNTRSSQGDRFLLQPQTITALAWSPDGKQLATAGDDRLVRIYNPLNGALLTSFSHPSASLTALAWSPQGTHLASASADSIVCLWDLSAYTKAAFHTYQHHNPVHRTYEVLALAWSPHGDIASGSMGVAQIWRSSTRLAEIRYDKWIVSLAWSPAGQYLAVSSDQVVTIRTLAGALKQTYAEHRPVKSQAPIIESILWSADGRYVISAGKNTTMHVWEMASAQKIHEYEGSEHIISLAQNRDYIFGLAADSSVYRWNYFQG